MFPKLETDRLILRAFEAGDIPLFSAYRSDPRVAQYQSWETPFSIDQATRFVDAMQSVAPGMPGEWYQVAVESKEKGCLIGDCAFHLKHDDPRQAEIGFTLASEHQGQGLATEAVGRLIEFLFLEYDLHRIQALCDVNNRGSYRLLDRLGMRREAHYVENYWFKGGYTSEYSYAILRREWG